MWLSVAPAGAGALVAVVALALRGRARWLRYLQIGLWLLALASFVYITANPCGPLVGLGPVFAPLFVGDISGVVSVVLLTRSLRRPAAASRAGTWRSSCWRWPWLALRLAAARHTRHTGRAPASLPES